MERINGFFSDEGLLFGLGESEGAIRKSMPIKLQFSRRLWQ
jgi:hypothetical protein